MFSRWITLRGVWGAPTAGRGPSYRGTWPARGRAFSEKPRAIEESYYIEWGKTAMPKVLKEPLEMGAARSSSS